MLAGNPAVAKNLGTDELKPIEKAKVRQALIHAEGYHELGLPHLALESLERVRPLILDDPAALCFLGEILRTLNRHEEALEPLRRATELAPELLPAWIAIGWCAKRTNRLDEAIAALEKAVKIAPKSGLTHYNLACYLSLAGKKTEALAELAQAIALDPDFRRLAQDETDFDPIRSDPNFLALLG